MQTDQTSAQRLRLRHRPGLARFAAPYTFGPDLSLGESLVAVAGCLARIFSGCVLFAIWGTVSVVAWGRIENRFWRVAGEVPLLLLFLAGFAALLAAVSAAERVSHSILEHAHISRTSKTDHRGV